MTTSFAPRVPDDGVENATEVSVIEPSVAADPPIVNPVVPVSPVPESTDDRPPANGPDETLREVIVGAAR